MLFADIPTVPWTTTGSFMLGLIGMLSVVWLILGVAGQARKLFGKTPPLSEELKGLREEIAKADATCQGRHNGALAEIKTERLIVEQKFQDVALDRHRSLGELHEKINTVALDVAFIRGKFTHETQKS